MCVSTLDLEHPEEKCSLVRGWIFFPTRRSAGRSGTRFHSGTEVVSFPDARVPTATGREAWPRRIPSRAVRRGLVAAQRSPGCVETALVRATVRCHRASPPPLL